MKKLIIILIVILLSQFSFAVQDTNLVWIIKYDGRLSSEPQLSKVAPDEKRLFVGTSTGNVRIIDYETGNFLDSVMGKGTFDGFSKDGKYFYTHTEKDIIKFDINTYKELSHLDNSHDKKGRFVNVKLMSDGRLAATLSQASYMFYILDGDSLKIQKRISHYNDPDYGATFVNSAMYSFCISPDGTKMAVLQGFLEAASYGKSHSKLNLWDLNNMSIIKEIPPLSGFPEFTSIDDMAFLSNSNILIVSTEQRLRFYDFQKVELIKALSPITMNFVISNDNQRNYFGSTNGVRLINTQNYQDICTSNSPVEIGNSYIWLSNDEKYLISAGAGNASLMKVKNCFFETDVKDPKPNKSEDFVISPNLTYDLIELSVGTWRAVSEPSDVRIYNLFGEIQSTPNPTPALPASGGQVRIDISGLAPGMYFVRIGDRVSKFIKL